MTERPFSPAVSRRRLVLILASVASSAVCMVSVWSIFFAHFSRWGVLSDYLVAAAPGMAMFSLVALYKLCKPTAPVSPVEEFPTTLDDSRFLAATESSLDAFFLMDAVRNANGEIHDFSFTYLNRKARTMLGLPDGRGIGDRICDLFPSFRHEGFFEQYRKAVVTGGHNTAEFSVQEEAIDARWMRSSVLKLGDGVAVTASDITEHKNFEDTVAQIAHYDPLTGLANRSLLDDRIQQALERAKRNRQSVAVMLLDLDHLKLINDRHGRAAGDQVLKTVASRLRSAVRATDSVFRLGGDEFVIVFGDIAATRPTADFVSKIMLALMAPIAWQKTQLSIHASVGMSTFPDAGTTPESLLVLADIAMHRMKRGQAAKVEAAAPREEFDLLAFPIQSSRNSSRSWAAGELALRN